jgi:hypothetical protein
MEELMVMGQASKSPLPALTTSAAERAPGLPRILHLNIGNKNTRAAYTQAAGSFLHWCGDKGITAGIERNAI